MPVETKAIAMASSTNLVKTIGTSGHASGSSAGFVQRHPAASWLDELGLTEATQFLELPGVIVSGHPDRHVMRIRLAGRTAYLKREHRIRRRDRFRHWREGFGWVSKSVREAMLLRALEAASLPAPRLLACGEDGNGRAFLLVQEVTGGIDLRRYVSQSIPADGGHDLPQRLGQAFAELHEAGFDHPDLYAKHCLIQTETETVTFLDWQRAMQAVPTWPQRIRALAAMHASLATELVSPRDRFRMLWAYRRVVRRSQRGQSTRIPTFAALVQGVQSAAHLLLRRRGIREQRQVPLPVDAQKLVWLDGEALCTIPELATDFNKPLLRKIVHDGSSHGQVLILNGGRVGVLESRQYAYSWGRWWARLRGRSWRSPELRRGRLLFHLERHHLSAPKLLAFGQRDPFGKSASAFLVFEPIQDAIPFWEWYNAAETPQQLRMLKDLGRFLARLHGADCRLHSLKAVVITQPESSGNLAIADINRITWERVSRETDRQKHLAQLWREIRMHCRNSEGLQILLGYLDTPRLTAVGKALARAILREAR